ncbi:MAG: hypothetical protein WCA11_10915 [Terracidiphilus sp.]
MRQETYRFAYEEAVVELKDIVVRFDQLRSRKERVERIVEALKPFADLPAGSTVPDDLAATQALYLIPQVAERAVELTQRELEPAPQAIQGVVEPALEPVVFALEESPETVELPAEVSRDPFQRRIDSVLWGWSQKREGMLPAV